MRLLVLLLTISAATTTFASSKKERIDRKKVDPIVTGSTIKQADKRAWLRQRDAARRCPKCAVSQPFPENDLPITPVTLKQ